jgi:acetyl-CoA decarbonylase/synthase complex subunit gamma
MVLLSGILSPGSFLENILRDGPFSAMAILGSVLAGTVFTPILLPYLPGRAFTTKGLAAGFLTAMALFYTGGFALQSFRDILAAGAWLLMIPAIAGYLAMNFTGASTYTSLSGVKEEMRWALPLEIGTALSGFAAWIVSRFPL